MTLASQQSPAAVEAAFEPADPPRSGTVLLWGAGPEVATVVPSPGTAAVQFPARRLTVDEALPLLLDPGPDASGSVAFWAAAAREALQLVARGRILPGVTAGGIDAWRAGPLDAADAERVAALAAAMPPEARARPDSPARTPRLAALVLPAAGPLLRAFLDAVADTLPRSPDADGPYAGPGHQLVPELREWAEEVAAGVDAGMRASLRVEAPDDPGTGRFRVVVRVLSLADGREADLADVWSGAAVGFGPHARIDALLAVRRASRFWDRLGELLVQAVPDGLELDDEGLSELLGRAAESLAASGVVVAWPVLPTVTTRALVGGPAGALGTALDLRWELSVRSAALTAAERDEIAAAGRPVLRVRDEWVFVDPVAARRARERTAGPVPAVAALGAALVGTIDVDERPVEVASTGWLDDLRARIAVPAEPVAAPDALAATLRDYQLRGLGWLHRMTSLGLGACLADDMGLGKTVTLIALHLLRGAAAPTLVVCPASLLGNWEREIRRFAPGVPVVRFHGAGRLLDAGTGFVLTTYGTLRRDAPALAAHGWDLVVADEAQHVKNPASGTAQALRTIPSDARVALTGTPVENDLLELWAVLDWATPGLLGSRAEFRARWAGPIADGDRAVAARFSRLVAPFLLRRRKADPGIAPELPRKTETDRPVGLTREQTELYQAAVAEHLARIAGADGMARRGLVLALLTSLKQICNHPAQYLREDGPLDGRSGKLELLDDLLDTILAEDGSVLVFTQYVTMARLLERHLRERGVGTLLLHGGTPVPVRERFVEAFQRGEAPVFLLSLKAAGTGLNLTRADHVVHYDRWWNPAVEDQATDRAHRIGQTRPVQVHRIITEGTLEDRIAGMLEAKRELADSVLGGGEAALTELTDAALAELVTLREGA